MVRAQAWYRANLLFGLDEGRKKQFAEFEQQLYGGVETKGQDRRGATTSARKHQEDDRMLGELRALEYSLSWKLPEQAGEKNVERREEFKVDPALAKKLQSAKFKPGGGIHVLSATTNLGQAYRA